MVKRKIDEDEDGVLDDDDEEETSPNKSKSVTSASKKKTKSGEVIFELGQNRRATVSEFKGKHFVNIREFYEDKVTGELKPGAKGIALTIAQFESLRSQMDKIQEAIDEMTS